MSQKKLSAIIQIPGNNFCADCTSLNVDFVSCKYGILICSKCAEIHRILQVGCNAIKRIIDPSSFTDADFANLQEFGNTQSRAHYEAILPNFYRRPTPDTPMNCIREEFIRAKYERLEFTAGNECYQRDYSSPTRRGILMKRHRDNNNFVERNFELNLSNNSLRYFVKPDAKDAKAVLDLEKLNACIVDESAFKVPKNTMIITYIQEGSTRNIFVYSENSREIINWYNSIRCCKMHRLCLSLTGMGETIRGADLAEKLTFDYSMFGWLEKTGPRPGDAWRKRWCMLGRRKLLYCEDSLSAMANGEIFVGNRGNGFHAEAGVPDKWKTPAGHAFTLVTPERNYVFLSASQAERDSWVLSLNRLADKPMTLEEIKEEATVARK